MLPAVKSAGCPRSVDEWYRDIETVYGEKVWVSPVTSSARCAWVDARVALLINTFISFLWPSHDFVVPLTVQEGLMSVSISLCE